MSSFTPGGIVFILVTISLPIIGIFLKKRICSFFSLYPLGIGLLMYLFVFIPLITFFVPIQGILFVVGNFVDKLIHNFGFIFIPLVVNLVALKFSSRKANRVPDRF